MLGFYGKGRCGCERMQRTLAVCLYGCRSLWLRFAAGSFFPPEACFGSGGVSVNSSWRVPSAVKPNWERLGVYTYENRRS